MSLDNKLANGGVARVALKKDKLEFELETREKPAALEPV